MGAKGEAEAVTSAVDWPPEVCPFDTHNFFQRLAFDYARPLLRIGASRALQYHDLPPVPKLDVPEYILDKVDREWQRELEKLRPVDGDGAASGRKRGRPNLFLALWRAFLTEFNWAALLSAIEDATVLTQVILLRPLLIFLSRSSSENSEPASLGYGYAAGIAAASFLQAAIHHQNFYVSMTTGWKLRIAMTAFIHRKLLKINTTALHSASAGSIFNLIASDVLRFDAVMVFLMFGWTSLISLGVIIFLLHEELGWAATVACAATVISIIVLQVYFGKQFAYRRRKTADITDRRVRLTSEVLGGVMSIKAYVWENAFMRLLSILRTQEHNSIYRSQGMKAINLALYFAMPAMASLVTFSVYSMGTHEKLNITKVYSAIAYIHAMRLLIGKHFARFTEAAPEAVVAVQRMQAFLLLPETTPPATKNSVAATMSNDDNIVVSVKQASFRRPTGSLIGQETAEAAAQEGSPVALRDINLKIKAGQLCIVTGAVGTGKSTLMDALLGELRCVEGSCDVKGPLSYAPQDAWIMAGSIRSNILFGSDMDPEKYAKAIHECALEEDIASLVDGDATEIGEKGVNLSGGQKARVALCRACYANSNLVCLDDPLSAVDPAVAHHLFHTCVVEGLVKREKRAVVLVTHQRQFMHEADVILVLGENGSVIAHGTFDDVVAAGIDVDALGSHVEDPSSGRQFSGAVPEEPSESLADASEEASDESRSDVNNVGNDAGMGDGDGDGTSKPTRKLDTQRTSITELVQKEDRTIGVVSWGTYRGYMKAAGDGLALTVFFLFMLGQVLFMIADWWLSVWAASDNQRSMGVYGVFVALTVATTIVSGVRALLFFAATLRASSALHTAAAQSIFDSPMSFFTANPLGRILNRFSSDLNQMDELLAVALFDTLQIAFMAAGAVILACAILPWITILIPPMVYTMFWMRQYTTKSMRELKRLDGTSRSPVYSAFTAAISGLVAIRAYGKADATEGAFMKQLTVNAQSWYWWLICNRWFGFWLDLLCFLLVAVTAFSGVLLRDSTKPGLVGLAMVYVLSLSGIFQYMLRQSALVETYMTSVERISHYAHRIPSEIDTLTEAYDGGGGLGGSGCDGGGGGNGAMVELKTTKSGALLSDSWPENGRVVFKDLCVRYRNDLPQIITNLTCEIQGGWKVGIVGRTGSGKSSLLLALSRLNEITHGDMRVDNTSAMAITLQQLRGAIAVIPQSPHLFSGTVRFNLDPYEQYDDAQVWEALEAASLKGFVSQMEHGLDQHVDEGGANWSVGQRQLLCIARALVSNRHIVVLDEATASVDFETDREIQRVLRESPAFKKATRLVIAHRMDTIIDSDHILVLDGGRLKESGSPEELLKDEGSQFSKMVAKAKRSKRGGVPVA